MREYKDPDESKKQVNQDNPWAIDDAYDLDCMIPHD